MSGTGSDDNTIGHETLVHGRRGTANACHTFPSFVTLDDGSCLACCRAGTTKDCADEHIRLFRSVDCGATWEDLGTPFPGPVVVGGRRGSLKLCYFTELRAGHIMAAALWVDRQTHPGAGLFNEKTEGCLPMAVLLSDSFDAGRTWSALRSVPLPPDMGPPSLTNPVFRLPNGNLALSIESNKPYDDEGEWRQRTAFFVSADGGRTWPQRIPVAHDPQCRIFHWDQRVGVTGDGRIAVFFWIYDRRSGAYLNIRRQVSSDNGIRWSPEIDLGFSDQPAHPAILADGRVYLPYVDRFGSQTVRVRTSNDIEDEFAASTDRAVYRHGAAGPGAAGPGAVGPGAVGGGETDAPSEGSTGAALQSQSLWAFGLPFADVLPDGNVLVMYYAGDDEEMDIRLARIST